MPQLIPGRLDLILEVPGNLKLLLCSLVDEVEPPNVLPETLIDLCLIPHLIELSVELSPVLLLLLFLHLCFEIPLLHHFQKRNGLELARNHLCIEL